MTDKQLLRHAELAYNEARETPEDGQRVIDGLLSRIPPAVRARMKANEREIAKTGKTSPPQKLRLPHRIISHLSQPVPQVMTVVGLPLAFVLVTYYLFHLSLVLSVGIGALCLAIIGLYSLQIYIMSGLVMLDNVSMYNAAEELYKEYKRLKEVVPRYDKLIEQLYEELITEHKITQEKVDRLERAVRELRNNGE